MPQETGKATDPDRVSRETAADVTPSTSPRVWHRRYVFVLILPQNQGFSAELDKDVTSHTSPMRPAVPDDVTLVAMGRP